MSRDKQIEEMELVINDAEAEYSAIWKEWFYDNKGQKIDREFLFFAKALYNAGYRKASEVALEAVDDFQRRLRHIFLDMCNGNDYDTLNLLQIDNAIEALYDAFVAELKKKYTERSENGKS